MAEIVPIRAVEPAAAPEVQPLQPLWRESVGSVLREVRQERGDRLADTAKRSGVSPQYLSEIERGLKDPSSEMIAAVAGALDLTLLDLTRAVAERLAPAQAPASAVLRAA